MHYRCTKEVENIFDYGQMVTILLLKITSKIEYHRGMFAHSLLSACSKVQQFLMLIEAVTKNQKDIRISRMSTHNNNYRGQKPEANFVLADHVLIKIKIFVDNDYSYDIKELLWLF